MVGLLWRIIGRFGRRRGGDDDDEPHAQLINVLRRKRGVQQYFVRYFGVLQAVLLLVGYGWLLALPISKLGRGTYIDENALQPGQVNTKWGWDDVHAADRYLDALNELRKQNATNAQLADWVLKEFSQLGIQAATQKYEFSTSTGTITGCNAYAVFAAPRQSGAEAMVISASWRTRADEGAGLLNERGVPSVLALARFLTRYSYWARDIVFVVSDGYLEGMHAWLSAYHGTEQPNLNAQPLTLTSGVIWTALAIDYPGHSFSHLGLFFEGLNGRLPNQDLMNSVSLIAQHTVGIPVVLYDNVDPPSRATPIPLPPFLVEELYIYKYRGRNILRHFGYEVTGRPSGIHGLFHKFRIDAITLFAVPADGPHGFHSLGRLVESTLRTMNNLLERLHASFFFYVMSTSSHFLKIGHYLPCAIILSIAITISGLGAWNKAGYTESPTGRRPLEKTEHFDDKQSTTAVGSPTKSTTAQRKRKRPVMELLVIMLGLHILGFGVLAVLQRLPVLVRNFKVLASIGCASYTALVLIGPAPAAYDPQNTARKAPLHLVLYSFTLLEAGMAISLLAVLNFALSASLAAVLALPLVTITPRSPRFLKLLLLALAAPAFIDTTILSRTVWEWEVLSAWALPVACCVYLPVVLQTWTAAFLSW